MQALFAATDYRYLFDQSSFLADCSARNQFRTDGEVSIRPWKTHKSCAAIEEFSVRDSREGRVGETMIERGLRIPMHGQRLAA